MIPISKLEIKQSVVIDALRAENAKLMNNKYKVIMSSPLLRAGVIIETECSQKYLPEVLAKMLDDVRGASGKPSIPWHGTAGDELTALIERRNQGEKL